ncbi:hypothetical protein DYH09_20745 [bacterium CPR1]|nr:hypothetical protein [bacterium CPR1]
MVGMSVPFMLPAASGLDLPAAPQLAPVPEFRVRVASESRFLARPINVPVGAVAIAGLPAGLRNFNSDVAPADLQVMGAVASLKQRVMTPLSHLAAPTGNPYARFFQQARF